MNLFEEFESNTEAENNGVWIEYGTNSKGQKIRFLIARSGKTNTDYLKTVEKLVKQSKTGTRVRRDLTAEEGLAFNKAVFLKAVLKGWEGVENRQKEDIPYNAANAADLMNRLPDLYADLERQADERETFVVQELEEDAKN